MEVINTDIPGHTAQEKGIDAIMINDDTTHMANIWKRARTTAAMAYLSPEMAFSLYVIFSITTGNTKVGRG